MYKMNNIETGCAICSSCENGGSALRSGWKRGGVCAGFAVSIAGRAQAIPAVFQKEGKPDWWLLDLSVAAALPPVRWRMANLARLDEARRGELAASAETALGGAGGCMSVAQSRDRER